MCFYHKRMLNFSKILFLCHFRWSWIFLFVCLVFFFFFILFSSVQSLSRVQLFATPWTSARKASLSITNSQGPPKPTSIESVMPSNHLTFCRLLILLPSIIPSIRVFSNESALHIKWPKYWSFSFNISPSNEHSGLISFRMDWLTFILLIWYYVLSIHWLIFICWNILWF